MLADPSANSSELLPGSSSPSTNASATAALTVVEQAMPFRLLLFNNPLLQTVEGTQYMVRGGCHTQ